ncbi:OmpA family protein [Flavobacterium aurantiibacter]|nr:OmpA family protein [Flavobacterium aurantiibacter]
MKSFYVSSCLKITTKLSRQDSSNMMSNKIKVVLILLLSCLTTGASFAQKKSLEKADKKYSRFAYVDAIEILEKVAKKGYKDEKMFLKLGNAYFFNAEYDKAEAVYRELFALNSEQNEQVIYRYALSLKSVGKYEEADKYLEKFNAIASADKRASLFNDNRDYLEVIKMNSKRYYVEDAGINSVYSDYGSSMNGDKLVFATARDTGGLSKKKFKWNNKYFTNLFSSDVKEDFDAPLGNPKRYGKKLNSKFHEASAVFTKDGTTMYFTRNNYLNGQIRRNDSKDVLLKIYRAKWINGTWSNVIELPFDSDEYSCAHPALSPDEKTMYFASDMPGSFGASDLYKVAINPDGSFGTPVNLGSKINTPGRETFPFVSTEGELYFASDGHPGLGGLDIFVTKFKTDGTFGSVQNLGTPLNSRKDDFGFYMNPVGRTGFFTSNRESGKGFDDIYKFTELKKLNCEQVLEGILRDVDTNEPVVDAQLTLFSADMDKIATITTNKEGFYSFGTVDCDTKLFVRADKVDYETTEIPINTPKLTGNTYIPLTLKKRLVKIEQGTDLAERDVLDIPTIYFDLDKSFIRKDAAFELEKVLAVMNQYPKMKIDVRSHTDSRQTKEYNQRLSERRAKSTIAWLVRNGISPDRITGRGYGETQLVNRCADGVKCSEAEHQMNRRSQFIVVEF